MRQDELIFCYRAWQIQEKILVEQALDANKIEFEMLYPRVSAQAIYQELGPWDFFVRRERVEEVKNLIDQLPVDNEPTTPSSRTMPRNQRIFCLIIMLLTALGILGILTYRIIKHV